MRTAAALLLMASAAVAQNRRIEGTVTDAVVEENGRRRPLLRCEGTTNLPDGSRMDLHACYGVYQPGRHLAFRAVAVKDGRFAADLALFPEKNLAGTYVVRVFFSPYNQEQEVVEKLGKELRVYSAELVLTIGTDADVDADRRRAYARLGAEIELLRTVVSEVEKKLGQRVAPSEWEMLVGAWTGAIEAAERRVHGVPEYKAFGIADISEQVFEDLATCVRRVIDAAAARLAAPDDPKAAKAFEECKKGFEWTRRPAVLRLGLEKATSGEITEMIPPLRAHLFETLRLYGETRRVGRDVADGYRIVVSRHRREFREGVLRMSEVSHDRHAEAVRGLMEKGLAFFRAAIEAGDFKQDRREDLRDLLDEFDKQIKVLQASLKE